MYNPMPIRVTVSNREAVIDLLPRRNRVHLRSIGASQGN